MEHYLNFEGSNLKDQSAYWTAKEICQQPSCWQKTCNIVDERRREFESWLKPLTENDRYRIILTGAGTSAYAGQALAPWLSSNLGVSVEAIATTDLVSNPDQYFIRDIPTLVVSFARSGNSPESVAACELADQLVDQIYQLVVTCNKDSSLAGYCKQDAARLCLLMPEETLDQSFAMTSSFTSMMVAVLSVFCPDREAMRSVIEHCDRIIGTLSARALEIANKDFDRIVFLGSGGLQGIATEARLKILELTAGKLNCFSESPLGFRHGPKFIANEKTIVVFLSSTDKYTRKYDDDLIAELRRDGKAMDVIDLAAELDLLNTVSGDVWLSFPYIAFCQILAFYKSIEQGCTPDNPSPSGEVNRVVQGVTIYPFES